MKAPVSTAFQNVSELLTYLNQPSQEQTKQFLINAKATHNSLVNPAKNNPIITATILITFFKIHLLTKISAKKLHLCSS